MGIYLYYLLEIGAAMLLAVNFAVTKKYQLAQGVAPLAGLRFYALNGLLTAIVFWIAEGFSTDITWYSFLMAFLSSTLCTIYGLIGFKILKEGNMVLYTLFLMSGGMVLPYIFGLIFLDEDLTVMRVAGLIAILGAVILTNRGAKKPTKKQLILCILVFVINGFVSIVRKIHQVETNYPVVTNNMFVMLGGLSKFILSSACIFFLRKTDDPIPVKPMPLITLSFAAVIIGGVSNVFQLIGATNLPATVNFPLITGGSIAFTAVASRVFFKEKISVYQYISIGLCIIGTILFV